MKNKTFSIISLGCPRNTVESEVLKGGLIKVGLTYTNNIEISDIIIINTCGFIEEAREESIDTILDVIASRNGNPLQKVYVIGCLSQIYGEELKKELPELDGIFGVNSYDEVIGTLSKEKVSSFCNIRSLLTPSHYAYLKIAEGCDNTCSFCSIPFIRGKQVSRTIEDIVKEAEYLCDKGVKELILIAQDLTRYGADLPEKFGLFELLEKILSLNLFTWVRIMYSNPDFWSPKLNELFNKFPSLCPYVDIPVQHASDKILKQMRRGKDSRGIYKTLKSIRESVPEVALRTSVMVGFPNETEDDFNILLDFIEEVRFERLGVFTYSKEEGTAAAKLADDVPFEDKECRKETVMQIQWNIASDFAKSKIGEEIDVILETKEDSAYIGRSVWDAPEIDCCVKIQSHEKLNLGEFYKATIIDTDGIDLVGKIKS